MHVSRHHQLLLDLDELKSDPACTRKIVEAIRQLLCLDKEVVEWLIRSTEETSRTYV